MSLLEQSLILFGVVISVVVWGLLALRAPRNSGVAPPGAQTRRLRVKGRYQPAEIHIEEGRPTRLLVRRDETAPCSERIVFPAFGLNVGLPPFTEVAIDLPASAPGDYRFCCQMDMLEGHLVVDPVTSAQPAHEAVSA